MVDLSDGRTIVSPPAPPDDEATWYAPEMRAQYEPYPGVVATVSERPDAAGSEFRYETCEPSFGSTGGRMYSRREFKEVFEDGAVDAI